LALVADLNRARWLPAYRDDRIRQIVAELQTLSSLIEQAAGPSDADPEQPEIACAMIAHYHAALFNKRAVLAYLNDRLERLKSYWWTLGQPPADVRGHTSAGESRFLDGYARNLRLYQQVMDMDLTLDQDPPASLLVEVRVLQSCGTIQTDNGPLSLEQHSTHLVRRHDVELLIRQGMLEETAS
ncbi:hypothetical protein PBRA_000402, partial [Plasmodiophora brassicae]